MSDYAQVNDYSAKDALPTGNPAKLIKGSDMDAEFDALATAITSKYDDTDLANVAQAQAATDNSVLMTPARVGSWAQNAGGMVEDIQGLADPNADRVLFWDDSAGSVALMTISTGLTLSGTTLTVNEADFTRTLTAGNGLSGGGDLSADRTFTLDLNELGNETTIAAGDFIPMVDITDSGSQKITFANFESALDIQNLSNAPVLTAGEGLSYTSGGSAINLAATMQLDINELTTQSTLDGANDYIPFYDASATGNRKVALNTLLDKPGDMKVFRSTALNLTSTPTVIVFNSTTSNDLVRGTYSTSTGVYTVGSSACRLLVIAQLRCTQIETDDGSVSIRKNGVNQATGLGVNRGGYGTSQTVFNTSVVVDCAAGDTIDVTGVNDTTQALTIGASHCFFCIVELT